MVTRIRTPENQNSQALPVGRPDAANARRVAFDDSASQSTATLPEGVYMLSVSAAAFVCVSPEPTAGDLAGSFPLGAGGGLFLRLAEGDKVAARGLDGPGALFVMPLENA